MKKSLLLMGVAALLFSGCARMDDIEDRVDGLEQRVDSLEQLVKEINEHVGNLQTLVNTIEKGGYVKTVSTEVKDGVNYYTLTLSDGRTIIVHDGAVGATGATGAAGQDGHTPVIGVQQDEDGVYYWTVDGQFIEPKMKVQGEDGQDGSTPQIKIQDGYWYMLQDVGEGFMMWMQIGKATGEDGDSFFQSVVVDEANDKVVFTLSDGSSFEMSLLGNFRLACASTTVGVVANTAIKVSYEVKGVAESDEVVVYAKYVSAGWEASVDEANKTVQIQVPASTDGLVVIEAVNNTTSQTATQALRFEDGILSVADQSVNISDASNAFEVSLSTNMAYEVSIDVDWIKQVQTKAAHTEKLQFTADLNEGVDARTGNITIKGEGMEDITVVVLQKGCPPLKESYEIGEYYERQGVVGIVWYADADMIKVLSLNEKSGIQFSKYTTSNSWADNAEDGFANQKKMLDNPYSSITYFLAHEWAYKLGNGWYLPAQKEMEAILNAQSTLNSALSQNDGESLKLGQPYWSSTQNTSTKMAMAVTFDYDYYKAVSEYRDITKTGYARASYNVSLKSEDNGGEETDSPIGRYVKDGDVEGIVAIVNEDGKTGYVISLTESEAQKFASSASMDSFLKNTCKSTTDGKSNMSTYYSWTESYSGMNSFTFARNLGNGWFVPAIEQLEAMLSEFDAINAGLEKAGATPLTQGRKYWSDTATDDGEGGTMLRQASWDGSKTVRALDYSNWGGTAYTRALHAVNIPEAEETGLKIGDKMELDGAEGVIAWLDDTKEHGLVISKLESDEALKWISSSSMAYSKSVTQASGSETDGYTNKSTLYEWFESYSSFPAVDWARKIGTQKWYLPAINELMNILANMNDINKGLQAIGGTPLKDGRGYWSSTTWWSDDSGVYARYAKSISGTVTKGSDEYYGNSYYVRAVHTF